MSLLVTLHFYTLGLLLLILMMEDCEVSSNIIIIIINIIIFFYPCCMVKEMRWKRKRLSCSLPLDELMRRQRALRKSTTELLRTPVFSTAIGWKRYDCNNTACLLIVLIAACSAGTPASCALLLVMMTVRAVNVVTIIVISHDSS